MLLVQDRKISCLIDIIQSNDHIGLYKFLIENNFPDIKDHTDLVSYATIFRFIHNKETAGYVWMYELKEEDGRFQCHLCIANKYKGKINMKKYYYQINACIKFNIKKIICNNTFRKML